MGRKLLIDVDTGIDDAAAIILALGHPDVEVLGVTCVSGNAHVDQATKNTLRVLKTCNRLDIPIYRGAEAALLSTVINSSRFHGNDGMGGLDWTDDIEETNIIQSQHAVTALVGKVNEFKGEITLVAVGPLTNIALALKIDPQFGKKLKDVFIMGGNIKGIGNITASAEHNFFTDPEAALICLQELHDVHIVPWETCMDAEIPWQAYDQWTDLDTPKSRFVKKITSYWVENLDFRHVRNGIRLCDLFAMATVLQEAAVVEKKKVHATVELQGCSTRGQMVVDWRSSTSNIPNVTVITKISTKVVASLFKEALNF